MDKKQLIILIVMIVIYLISSIRKAKSKKQTMHIPEVDTFEEPEKIDGAKEPSFSELQIDYKMSKNAENHSRNSNFGQYRHQTLETLETDYNPQINPQIKSQSVDNEEYSTVDISMEIDDVRKGFIYSEILKNKYN